MMTPPGISYLPIFIAFALGVMPANFALGMIHPGFTG